MTLGARNGTQHGGEASARVYFDYALTGILETDDRWLIMRANPAAASITGHDRRQLLHLSLSDLLAPSASAQANRHFDLLLEQGIARSSWETRRRDNTVITTEWESVQVADDLYIHIFDDVTVQRRAAADLEAARAAAEAANRSKSEFLANVSHEIRTPMNGILGLSQLALMTNLTAEQREYLEKIAQSGRTLLKVINGLLDYAKIEAGRMEYECIPFGLNELLDELATITAQAAAAGDLEVAFNVGVDVPRDLVGDRLRLGQTLTNLIGNALKFTPAGTVELRITNDTKEHDHTWLRFEVRDTGIGIAADAMERLFQPFDQADAATARRFGGTGLGLAIAREFAVGMGGELTADSQLGVGTRFVLRLPFQRMATEEAPAAQAERKVLLRVARPATRAAVTALLAAEGMVPTDSLCDADLVLLDLADGQAGQDVLSAAKAILTLAGPGEPAPAPDTADGQPHTRVNRPLTPGSLRRALRELGQGGTSGDLGAVLDVPLDFAGAHVLVAEDNPVNQLVLLNLLRQAGIRTSLAVDGQVAVDLLTDPTQWPDIILMDVRMPGMDGLSAARELRRRGVTIPIVGVSAGASAAEQQACQEAGMSDFLPKPIDPDELWGCLTRWVSPPERRSSVAAEPGAEERFLGDLETLSRARTAFAETHADDAKRLAEAYSRSDREAAAYIAHQLKGAAATIGAKEIAELAATFEQQLAANEIPEAAATDLIARLADALTRFC